MKLIILILSVFILFGCVTEKKRARICATCTLKQTIKDSTGVSVVKYTEYDTLALIARHQGKDIQAANCDSLLALLNRNNDTVSTKANGVKATITKGVKGIKFRCETDSLLARIKALQKEIATPHYKTIINEVPARCQQPHRTDFDGFCRIFFWVMLAIGIVIGGTFAVKKYLRK